MINETKIKCFLTLAKTLNFTATANILFMSQQAVSKNISSLEKDFCFKLFKRNSHSVELTKEGEQCYAVISKLSEKFYTTISEIRHQYISESGTISVGYQSFLDFGSYPNKALDALRKKNPDVKVNVFKFSPSLLVERLINRQLNLVLMNGRYVPKVEGFKKLELTKAKLSMMISPDLPNVDENADYRDFIHEPYIVDSFENESIADYNKRVQQEIETWGLKPSNIIWVPDRDTAYTYAEMGKGIVIGTDMSLIARNRNLHSLFIGKYESLLAIWHEKESNPLVEEYAKYLQEAYQNK